jgi:hypothetical protein
VKIQLEKISPDKNQTFCCIDTGVEGTDIAVKTVSQALKQNGFIISGKSIDFWKFSGLKQVGKKIYVYCPDMDGLLLSEVLELPLKESVTYINKLLNALKLLEERNMDLFKISAGSVFFKKSGDIIIFPPELMERIRLLRDDEYRIFDYQLINHPDLPQEFNISFSIACILYKAVSGIYPFYSEDEEELDSMKRMLEVISLSEIIPGISNEISVSIANSLNYKNYIPLSVSKWCDKLDNWQDDFDILEKQKSITDSDTVKERLYKNEKVFNKRLFWKRNWSKITLQAGAALAVVLIVFYFVNNFLKPRTTQDFPPDKVVETFYMSANTLDHVLMDNCVMNDAGSTLRNETMHLAIIDKMQAAKFFNDNYVINADWWIKNGKPEIPSTSVLFGITDFYILENTEISETERRFKVKYVHWCPKFDETDTTGSVYQGISVTEVLHLKIDRGGWVIYSIETISESPVE